MRFVPVQSEDVQGAAMVFRVRELLIRQRTQAINSLRGHLREFGEVVPEGAANATRLSAIIEGDRIWQANVQRSLASTQGAEIRHRPVQPDEPHQAFNEPGRLPQRHSKRHLQGQAPLDCGIA